MTERSSHLLQTVGLEPNAFEGRTALITGAARGIGKELAHVLSRLGAGVVIADVRAQGQTVADEITKAGGRARFIQCDLAQPDEVTRMTEEAAAAFGGIDILVNGAMTMVVAPIPAVSLDDWDHVFDVNLRAAFLAIQRVLPVMMQRGDGVIVNLIAYEGSPLTAAYAATKVGLRSLALTAAREVGPDAGVSVFAFVPGIVDTPAVQETLIPGLSAFLGVSPEDLERTVLAQNPGYEGLMPVEHCAAALAYAIARAPEYHGQVADPFEPLNRFGVIDIPAIEETLSTVLTAEGSLPHHLKQYLSNVTQYNRELEKRIEIRTRELAEEHARSEALLLNILPGPIAERLKDGEATIADSFDDVTVLFADIVDFTPFAATLNPTQVVQILDSVFSEFDLIAEKHSLEKIKTIGDCYMMVGGLPEPRADHVEGVLEAAIDIRATVAELSSTRGVPLSVRIGVHTGPVVAGVIGRRKFIYDLWGDTVNVASRMESHGTPGLIHCSEAVHERMRESYRFESRGEIVVKGRGPMQTFFLLGRRL